MKTTASSAILGQLAEEHRHVLSGWRGVVLLRRATFSTSPNDRRWQHLPQHVDDMYALFRQMRARGEIQSLPRLRQVYEVTVPYAQQGFVDEREVLLELHPYATLSHASALVFHGLSNEQPKNLTATVSSDIIGDLLPIGTTPIDWDGLYRPRGTRVPQILGRPVHWVHTKPDRYFGFVDYQPLGFPLRYTIPERTLIDALQEPDLCGGISNVLSAWVRARDIIDVDILIEQAERYSVAILRQRVGYILDQLGLPHHRLEDWALRAQRGGSSRLVGSQPFDSHFDERWKISLNGPIDILLSESP